MLVYPILRAVLDLNPVAAARSPNAFGGTQTHVRANDLPHAYTADPPEPLLNIEMVSNGQVTPLAYGCTDTEALSMLSVIGKVLLEADALTQRNQAGTGHPLDEAHFAQSPLGAATESPVPPAPPSGSFTSNGGATSFHFTTAQINPQLMEELQDMQNSLSKEQIEKAFAAIGMVVCPTCAGHGVMKQGEGLFVLQVTCATCHGAGWIRKPEDPPAAPAPVPTDPPPEPPTPASDAAPVPATTGESAPVDVSPSAEAPPTP